MKWQTKRTKNYIITKQKCLFDLSKFVTQYPAQLSPYNNIIKVGPKNKNKYNNCIYYRIKKKYFTVLCHVSVRLKVKTNT